ncbi:hypothetical protein KSS87_014031 [Heliosperma pusillum]|nr:hypothetical protein KSS87_014031 [Heliosperma pusillum]
MQDHQLSKMASTIKGLLIRSAPDVCTPAVLRVKHMGHIGLPRDRNLFGYRPWNQNQSAVTFARASQIRSQAVMAPVSDPTSTARKRVFTFGKGKTEGDKSMKSLLGGKGANLAEMASIGLSVPPGLTISTEACQEYQENGKKLPEGLWQEILESLTIIEKDMGANLGDPIKPLLLSVRSGAAISMPGMMDTVLNLGLNDEVVEGLAAKSGERFAYDSYRRFLDMFGGVVSIYLMRCISPLCYKIE